MSAENKDFSLLKNPVPGDDEFSGPLEPLNIYYRDVRGLGKQLLTREEEVELSKSIQLGAAARKWLIRKDLFSEEETVSLQKLSESGMEARNRMVEMNLRLVAKEAVYYAHKSGLDKMDLMQEGNIALAHAAELFDFKTGNKFSTYAFYWIKQAVTRYIANNSNMIRIPIYMIDKLGWADRAERLLKQNLGRDATDLEIAEEMGISPAKLKEIRDSRHPVSSFDLDTSENGAGGASIIDFIEDPESREEIERQVMRSVDEENIDVALKGLRQDRDRTILELRFGLKGGRVHTLEETGAVVGLTKERVRQVEGNALRTLRGDKTLKETYSYLSPPGTGSSGLR